MSLKLKLKFTSPDFYIPENIAIVGSSANLLENEYGTLIDSFDCVVRFNQAETKGYEKHVGSKTDIRIVNADVFKGSGHGSYKNHDPRILKKVENSTIFLWTSPNRYDLINKKERYVHKTNEVYLVKRDNIKPIALDLGLNTKKENLNLTLGVGFVTLCVHMGIKPTLFGFDIDSELKRTHYWGKRPPASNNHEVNYEMDFLKLLNKQGKIEIVNKINPKIKLIIWDLDDTLWKGTLAEGPVVQNKKLFKYIEDLLDVGVVSSICSLNDFEKTKNKLIEIDKWKSFVFPKISFNTKGPVIKGLIDEMNLREENVLFVDDKISNLEEAKFYCPKINTISPEDKKIYEFIEKIISSSKPDRKRKRLRQYRVLENKQTFKKENNVEEKDFLVKSQIKISIHDSEDFIDRIEELVNRTNQLNYTKSRSTKQELIKDIKNNKSFVVRVKDNFGDYDISGFVCYNDKEIKHFVFSCRILNMGIESFVFHHYGLKPFKAKGDVAYSIYDYKPDWIEVVSEKIKDNVGAPSDKNIIFVGGCDLRQAVGYVKEFKNKVEEHFTYRSQYKNIPVHRDSIDILLNNLSQKDIEHIDKTCPFVDKCAFEKIDYSNYDTIVYSPIIDYIQGKYVCRTRKINDFYLSCNPILKDGIKNVSEKITIAGKINHNKIVNFNKHWKYVEKTIEEYRKQLNSLFEIWVDKRIIVVLGATNTYSDMDSHLFQKHIDYNNIIKEVGKEYGVQFIEIDDFIKSRKDFNDNIRHYTRNVYYKIGEKIYEILKR